MESGRRYLAGGLLLAGVEAGLIGWVDYPLARYAATLPPWVARVSRPLTWAGEGATSLVPLGIAILVLALLRGRAAPGDRGTWTRPLAVCCFLFLAVALSGLAVDVIKVVVGRPRPAVFLHQGDSLPRPLAHLWHLKGQWQSFPSGHANTLMALALAGGVLWPGWRWPLVAAALALATTRLWLGAHYPSDLVGGFAVAVLTTDGLRRVFQRRGWLAGKQLL